MPQTREVRRGKTRRRHSLFSVMALGPGLVLAEVVGSRVLSTVAVAPPSLFAVPALPDDAAHRAHLAGEVGRRDGDAVLRWVAPIFLCPPRRAVSRTRVCRPEDGQRKIGDRTRRKLASPARRSHLRAREWKACFAVSAYFFAGAFPPATGLRSNAPSLSRKNRHSEALSQEVVCL